MISIFHFHRSILAWKISLTKFTFRSCGWKMDLCVPVISSVIKRLDPKEHNTDAKGCQEVIGEIASCRMDCIA